MFLRINDLLVPLDNAIIDLNYAHAPGVLITVGEKKVFLRDEIAETARNFFDALQAKGQVIDLRAAFLDAQGKIEEKKEETFKHSTPTPLPSLNCALAPVHPALTIPCPSRGYQNGF
jgi:hypothetical protein